MKTRRLTLIFHFPLLVLTDGVAIIQDRFTIRFHLPCIKLGQYALCQLRLLAAQLSQKICDITAAFKV
jgi:hypothetical protein